VGFAKFQKRSDDEEIREDNDISNKEQVSVPRVGSLEDRLRLQKGDASKWEMTLRKNWLLKR
jgi:hypothetical protein